MENPFHPSFWSNPSRPRAAPPSVAKPSRHAKVVSIPVHFVGSDEEKQQSAAAAAAPAVSASRPREGVTMSAAALTIQRVFRGFLVRKHVRTVRRLEAEVDAVEKEVKGAGEERLRRDAKERLRVNETLMSLLFRLDSVRGVRDYRRRVIRRAIALQEAVDAIAAGKDAGDVTAAPGNDAAPCEVLETPAPMEIPPAPESGPETPEGQGELSSSGDEDKAEKVDVGDSAGDGGSEEAKQEEDTAADATVVAESAPEERGGGVSVSAEASEEHDGDQLGDVIQASAMQDEEKVGEVETVGSSAATAATPSCHPVAPSVPAPTLGEEGASQGSCGDDMRRAMERVVEESKGLKGLVAELCERNELQLRLMDGLLQRVERLEKKVEKRGRAKKRGRAADAKKCCDPKCEKKSR